MRERSEMADQMADQPRIDPELRKLVAELVKEEPDSIPADANLFEVGLESIALMRLINGWRQAGLEIDFASLSKRPTLRAWSGLLDQQRGSVDQEPAAGLARRMEPDAEFPLGLMQHAYWVGRTGGHRLGGVAAHLYTEFDGSGLEPRVLEPALRGLLARHDMLRCRITANGTQIVGSGSGRTGLAVHDLRNLPQARLEHSLKATRQRMSHQVLDLEQGQVFAAALTLLPGGRHRFHLDVDMVAADAVSYRILLADLARLCADPDADLAPNSFRYQDYLSARASIRNDAKQRAADYWKTRLPELPAGPSLPVVVDRRDARQAPRVARRHLHLSAQRYRQITAAARRHGVTSAMVMATLFAETVGRWSATPRFLLNVPLFDRIPVHPDVEHVVGDFSSSVLLEVDLSERIPFLERARALQSRMHSDTARADYSGIEVLRDLSRRTGKQVLAPVVFTSALNLGDLFASTVIEQFGEPVWIISQGPQVLLDAQITELGGGVLVNWDSREEVFHPGVLDTMFDAFERQVARLADDFRIWSEPLDGLLPVDKIEVRCQSGFRVLDDHGRDQPDWVAGRLFTPGPNGEWEATGEIARFRADSTVQRFGAVADVFEHHGVPVLPAEIEGALRTDNRVHDAAVVLEPGTKPSIVVAVVVPAAGWEALEAESVRSDLWLRAPSHLVPERVVVLVELPRGADGQVDRAALQSAAAVVAAESGRRPRIGPRSALERAIALVWEEVLPVSGIGVTEEFLTVGGDSVLAASIVSRLREALDTSAVSLRMLFAKPTISGLAAQLDAAEPGRLERVAEIFLEIEALSDDQVALELDGTVGST